MHKSQVNMSVLECSKKVLNEILETSCYCSIVALKIEKKLTKNNDLIMVLDTCNEFCCIMEAIKF